MWNFLAPYACPHSVSKALAIPNWKTKYILEEEFLVILERRKDVRRNYQKTKIEADDDIVGDGHCGEFEVAQMAGEGLGDDQHGVCCDAAEDGWTDDVP